MKTITLWAAALILALTASAVATALAKALADWLGVPFILVGGGW